ncbi:hypothetical protein GOV07_04800, partial [Candidatus Woesearchaeota archaeon]|nr:hypothetical protein [Candidatus Woesearchaeota archaeon]
MIPTIEFACTANQGRSPVAELIARNYIARLGAQQDLEAISSGSHAAAIQAGVNPVPVMLRFIELARGRTENVIYTTVDEHGIDEAIKTGDDKAIAGYFHMAEQVFNDEEMVNRAAALQHFG